MNLDRFKFLWNKHLHGNITTEEEEELSSLILEADSDESLKNMFRESWDELKDPDKMDPVKAGAILAGIIKEEEVLRSRESSFLTRRTGMAAAVVLLLALGAYFIFLQRKTGNIISAPVSINKAMPQQISPGKDGAVLTLADGSQIVLDSLGNGIIGKQDSTQIMLRDGQLIYQPVLNTGKENSTALMYNTMSTPKGRQFRLVLPDGSAVWLNAASSVKYPVAFNGQERVVEITGEVYFEVVHRPDQPFLVRFSSPGNEENEIEVLGTSFNVNAYSDEPDSKTTLLEGAVRIHPHNSGNAGDKTDLSFILRPGQQAVIPSSGPSHRIASLKPADIEAVVAWKNGRFEFNNHNLKDIMRQIGRWYDMDIKFEGDPESRSFGGGISRTENVSEVLRLLELTGSVHFRIENRTIIATP